MAKESKTEKLKRVAESVELAAKLIKQKSEGAEGVMVSFHVVKNGKLIHFHHYENFPSGDWGKAVIAMACEARTAIMLADSGAMKK